MVRPRFLHTSLDELIYRFEEPTPEARWHRPLFTTTTTGAPDAPECLPTPLDGLWEAITQAKVQPPKAVTLVRKKTTNNSLELLDTVTQAVLGAISEYRAQGGAMCGSISLSTLEHVSLTCSSSDATPTICARVCRKGGIRGQFGPHITARTGATHCTNVYCMVTRNSYF